MINGIKSGGNIPTVFLVLLDKRDQIYRLQEGKTVSATFAGTGGSSGQGSIISEPFPFWHFGAMEVKNLRFIGTPGANYTIFFNSSEVLAGPGLGDYETITTSWRGSLEP